MSSEIISSEIPYFKMAVCIIPIFVAIGITIVGKTWIAGVFRNPDATDKGGMFAALASIGALEIMFLLSLGLLFTKN